MSEILQGATMRLLAELAEAARIAEARKAAIAVYITTDKVVADDLSRILNGLADALEAAEQKIAAGIEYLELIREDHAPHILVVRDGAITTLTTPTPKEN